MLPVSLILTVVATFGPGTLIAAMNVKYRHFRYILPFLVQILLFLTPVIYPVSMVGNYPWLQKALALNPMYAPISLNRNVLVESPLETEFVFVSVSSGVVFFILGILYFRKTESYFADLA